MKNYEISTAENFSQKDIYDFEKKNLSAYQHKLRVNAIANEIFTYIKQKNNWQKISILEIGCGEGRLLRYIADFLKLNYYAEIPIYYSGIDPSQIRIYVARKIFPNCIFYTDTLETFTSKQNYDIVVCSEVIEHVESPYNFLRRIKDLMNKKSILIITTPNILTLDNYFKKLLGFKVKPMIPSHVREYTYDTFRKLLSKYFIIGKYYSIGFRLPLYWKIRKILDLPLVYKNTFKLSRLFPQYGRILLAKAYKKTI